MVTIKLDRRLLSQPLDDSVEYHEEGYLLVLRLPAGSTVQGTLKNRGVMLNQTVIPVINNRTSDFNVILEENDIVRLLPQIAGG